MRMRRRKAFLFVPLEIGDETRWLERAEWIEVCREFRCGCGWMTCYWSAVCWADDPDWWGKLAITTRKVEIPRMPVGGSGQG
jgi:hypothetical protein